ncbi:MAG: glycosyltransferase family 2 protein [Ferruginibacter sp.]
MIEEIDYEKMELKSTENLRLGAPLVSVIMTSYNREKYIAEAIESVLASTYTNFELIIADDCSTDKTIEIAKVFTKNDKRIKLFVNQQNLGQFENRNKAAGYACGELQMWADSDDTLKPDAILYIVEQFEKYPGAKFSLIYGLDDINAATCLSSEEIVRRHFYGNATLHVGPGGTVIRRDLFKRIGGYPTAYGAAGDTYFNIVAASNTEVLLLPYIYFNYRIHGNQELNNKYAYLYNGYRYFEDIMLLPELPLTEIERVQLLRKNKKRFFINTLKYFRTTGEFKKTLKAYKIAGVSLKELWVAIFS